MAGALGFILGAGLRAVGEHSAIQRQQSLMQQESANKAMEDMFKSNPIAAAQVLQGPEGKKIGKRLWGEGADAMTAMLGATAKAKQAEDTQFAQLTGGAPGMGAVPSSGATPTTAGQPQQARQPQTLQDWIDYRQKLIQGRGHFTDANHLKVLDAEISNAEKTITQLRGEQIRGEFESPEAKAAITSAQTKARIGAETSPEAKTAEASLEAAKSAARLPYEKALANYHETLSSQLADAKDAKAKSKLFDSTVTTKAKERAAIVKTANSLPTQAEREAYINTYNSGIEESASLFDDPKQQEQLRKLAIPLAPATPGRFYGETPGLAGATDAGTAPANVDDFVKKYGGK